MPSHLYVHLPYCGRKCPYCDFVKKVPFRGELEDFLQALGVEIGQMVNSVEIPAEPVRTMYFGGGTPSLFQSSRIGQILERVKQSWGVAADCEITLEVNPGTVDLSKLRELRELGVNRLSIGAQSFSARKLRALYRDHSVEQIGACVSAARTAEFENVSLDLIFGLPEETVSEWRADLEQLLRFAPEHVSLYNLEYHEGTPFFRWRESGRILPLNEDLECEMYLLAHEFLTAHGYEHYEISNFARPGFRAIHNSIYWQRKPYVGLGPGAHSFNGVRRSHNTDDIAEYLRLLESGQSPVVRELIPGAREEAEERLSLLLRRSEGLSHEAAGEFLDSKTIDHLWQLAEGLPAGVCEVTSDSIRLTAAGWFRENSVLLWLFRALD